MGSTDAADRVEDVLHALVTAALSPCEPPQCGGLLPGQRQALRQEFLDLASRPGSASIRTRSPTVTGWAMPGLPSEMSWLSRRDGSRGLSRVEDDLGPAFFAGVEVLVGVRGLVEGQVVGND